MFYDLLSAKGFLNPKTKFILRSLALAAALFLVRVDAARAFDAHEPFRSGRSAPDVKSGDPAPAKPLTTSFERQARESVDRHQALLEIVESQSPASHPSTSNE